MNIRDNHQGFAAETDIPIAGLLTDLASRGLREDTLVIWGGEFGRLPLVQRGGTGRDHNPHAFTVWLAGSGVKGGVHHGATDDIGHRAVEDRVSVHDLHATILPTVGPRSPAPDLSLQRLRFSADGCAWGGGASDIDVGRLRCTLEESRLGTKRTPSLAMTYRVVIEGTAWEYIVNPQLRLYPKA